MSLRARVLARNGQFVAANALCEHAARAVLAGESIGARALVVGDHALVAKATGAAGWARDLSRHAEVLFQWHGLVGAGAAWARGLRRDCQHDRDAASG